MHRGCNPDQPEETSMDLCEECPSRHDSNYGHDDSGYDIWDAVDRERDL